MDHEIWAGEGAGVTERADGERAVSGLRSLWGGVFNISNLKIKQVLNKKCIRNAEGSVVTCDGDLI